MTSNEPKRLLEQPGSELDVLLLESALDEAPPARTVERTLVALGVASAATGLCAGAASTAAVKTGLASGVGGAGWFSSLSLMSKLGVGVALVTASVGVPYVLLRSPERPPATQASIAPAAAGERATTEGGPAEAPHVAAATDEPAAEPKPAGGAEASRPGGPGAEPATPPRVAEAAPPRKPAATAATQPDPKSGSPLSEEIKLLDAARGALRRGDKAASLALLDSYASRFPNGQLKAEAQSMRQVASQ